MRQLAGRFLNAVSSSPLQSAAAGGLATAGLSVGGNLASEEGREKGAARIALEALGAGALGAGVGSQIPAIKKATTPTAVDEYLNMRLARGTTNRAQQPGKKPLTEEQLSQAGRLIDMAAKAAPYAGGAAVGTGLLAATGLGGQIGGGVANLGNMAGLAIDPESPGSSNTPGSRMSMQPQMSSPGEAQMQDDIRTMRERQDQAAIGNTLAVGALGLASLGSLGYGASKLRK